jgi:hypothetical protein
MVFLSWVGYSYNKTRVDSGAKTSALHAINIAPFIKKETNWVRFDINPIQNNLKQLFIVKLL